MKRWIRFVALFYPRGWREEFGDEFDAVVDDVRPGWRVFANVLRGAMEMRMSEGSGWMRLVGATAVVGALAALGMSFMASQQNYRSSAMVTVMPQVDPVRSELPDAREERAIEHANEMRAEILSRSELWSVINDPRLLLYRKELTTMPIEDVIEHMRNDLQIQVVPPAFGRQGPIQLHISFLYPDRAKAEAAVAELTNKVVEEYQNTSRADTDAYQGFWGDISHVEHIPPVPPPPVGEGILVSRINPPTQAPPSRVVFLGWGLLAGLVVGLTILWPRDFFRLTGFAVAGFILAAGVSFLFPNRFTSTAEMQIVPAQLTEDPLAIPPSATPAVEFLKQFEPELFSDEGLMKIIEDPRLNLYSEERKRKLVGELVNEMRADLQIRPVDPARGAASAFTISFTYPDRFKAQQTVEAVMTGINEWNHTRLKADAERRGFKAHVIWERKAGEIVDVLDTANLPSAPVGPPRLFIALGGFAGGLLLGAFRLWRRRPDPPPQLNSNEMVLSNGV